VVRAKGARYRYQAVLKVVSHMNRPVDLETVIDASQMERVRSHGALVFDVDDTLLARERADGAGQETFYDSAAAALLPEFLRHGFNLCLITGHGWQQLESRLVAPIVERLRESGDEAAIQRLRVYANRGATKIALNDAGHQVDVAYGEHFQIRASDVGVLRDLLESLAAEFEVDVSNRDEWYRRVFPRFDFEALPARVSEREGAVLVLRPIPGRIHAANDQPDLDTRAELYRRGLELLQHADRDDYQLAMSGRSSIEIMRSSVSKVAALHDLKAALEALTGESAELSEAALVYVGDEFYAGGNDFEIPLVFPRALCLSVAKDDLSRETAAGVVQLTRLTGAHGTSAAEELLTYLLNLSA
jgi:hydroxymethylpyrimidine pyrophosphatase-like HAD family hydrolase